MVDLAAERAASQQRQEAERDRIMAKRIARKVYPVAPADEVRRINDALALEPLARYTSDRIDRVRKFASEEILELERAHKRSRKMASDRNGGRQPKEKQRMERSEVLELSITDIPGLPGAASNRLWQAGIKTVGDLVSRTEAELLEVKYVSHNAMKAIGAFLFEHDLQLSIEAVDEPEAQEAEVVHPPDPQTSAPEEPTDLGCPCQHESAKECDGTECERHGREVYITADADAPPELVEALGKTAELALADADAQRIHELAVRYEVPLETLARDFKISVEEVRSIVAELGSAEEDLAAPTMGEEPPREAEVDGVDRLRLEGPWGHVVVNKDAGHGYAQVELIGEVTPELADDLVAALLREKYLADRAS